jgi:hypothetical protein
MLCVKNRDCRQKSIPDIVSGRGDPQQLGMERLRAKPDAMCLSSGQDDLPKINPYFQILGQIAETLGCLRGLLYPCAYFERGTDMGAYVLASLTRPAA